MTTAKVVVERRKFELEVLIPKPGSWYGEVSGTYVLGKLVGPFHDSGDPWDRINLPTRELNAFYQGLQIEHESSVFHQKIDGKIYLIPGLKGMVRVGKWNDAGFPIYDVKVQWRIGASTYINTSVRTSLELIFTGQEAHGYQSTGRYPVYYGTYATRHGNYTIVGAQAHSFVDGAWGANWALASANLTISEIGQNTFKYRRAVTSPGGDVVVNDKGHFPGDLSVTGGIAVARNNVVYKDATTGPLIEGTKFFLQERDFSMSEVRTWIRKLVNPNLLNDLPSSSLESYGDLIMKATDNLDANSANMIAFVKDLRQVKTLIPKLKELGKIKTHTSNYLAYKYGVLPTIGDLESIFKAFSAVKYYDRSGYRRVSAYDIGTSQYDVLGRPFPVQHTRRVHVAVNDNDTGLDSLIEKARSIGVFPSLTNLWDLIPYSFVLDWFVDVGSVLERIDTQHRLINLDIPYIIKSDKIEAYVSFSDDKIGVGIDLTVSSYDRVVTREVPQPRIFGEILKPPTVQNHWIEGSALILQRTK